MIFILFSILCKVISDLKTREWRTILFQNKRQNEFTICQISLSGEPKASNLTKWRILFSFIGCPKEMPRWLKTKNFLIWYFLKIFKFHHVAGSDNVQIWSLKKARSHQEWQRHSLFCYWLDWLVLETKASKRIHLISEYFHP